MCLYAKISGKYSYVLLSEQNIRKDIDSMAIFVEG